MARPVLHQVTIGATVGDAITDHALLLRRWLREMGFVSEIYAQHIHPDLEKEVRPVATYRPGLRERQLIYHHSIGSEVVEWLLGWPLRFILIYHNVTPPSFFAAVDPALTRQMVEGRAQLAALCPRTDLALGDSPYNEAELGEAGFSRTGVLPIALDETRYATPPNPELLARLEGARPLLLFVGRQVPNKKQEDLLKLLYFCRRIWPAARLALVGAGWMPAYERWLRELALDLGLGDEAVAFMGHVSQQDMVTCYRRADLYVSMSEHEGFGKPLIESMYFGLPVLAYAASSVPGTLGGAGVLFHHKHYEALAELVDMLVCDPRLRQRVVSRQRERVKVFLEPHVRQVWQDWLGKVLAE
jgi:glycosyltransferase involved in cell wall biosynthesis